MRAIAGIFGLLVLLFCAGCGRPEPSGEDLVRTFRDNRALFEASRKAIIAFPLSVVDFDDKGRAKLTDALPPPPSPPTPEALRQLEALHAKTGVRSVGVGLHAVAVSFDMWSVGIVGSGRGKGFVYQVGDEGDLNIVPSIDAVQAQEHETHYSVAQKLDDHWYITLDE